MSYKASITSVLLSGIILFSALALSGSAFFQPDPNLATVSTVAQLPAGTGGVAVDAAGDIFVADIGLAPGFGGTTIYRVTPDGEVSIFVEHDSFRGATGNAFDSEGNLYQAAFNRGRISKITPEGEVSTVSSSGLLGPVGIAIDPDDNALFVANCQGRSVLKITQDGTSTTLTSHPLLNCPNGIALDDDKNVYVANFGDGRILKVSPDGSSVTEFAVVPGNNNGHITYGHGILYVVGRGGAKIYTLTLEGELEILAGSSGRGHDDGPALEATFNSPNDLSISPDGRTLYVNEWEESSRNKPSRLRAIHLADEE
jgi:DNA-binding beta-propeller fold protein YncE